MISQSRIGLERRLIKSGLAFLALLAAGSVGTGFINALAQSKDFEWSPSRLLLMHLNPYAMYLDGVADAHSANPFLMTQFPNYPAYGLVFLWPFAALPWPIAQVAWAVSNTLLPVGIVFLIHELYFKNRGGLPIFFSLLFLLLASTPYRNTLGNGQHGLFCLFFFLAAVYAANIDRPCLASLFLAVSWLKYSVTLPLSLLFLRRGRIHIAIFAAVIDLVISGFAAVWTNSSLFEMLYQPFLVQSRTLFKGYLDLFDILGFLGNARLPAAFFLSSLVIVATLWVVIRRVPQDELLLASLLSFAACIATLHLLYDFVVFLFPMAYAIRLSTEKTRPRISDLLAISFIASIVPIWYVQRLVEAFHLSHASVVSSIAVWICWAWIVVGTYGAFGLCIFACLRPEPAAHSSGRPIRSSAGEPVAATSSSGGLCGSIGPHWRDCKNRNHCTANSAPS